jgi:hypothetical protein
VTKSVALLVSRPEIRSVRPDARPDALLVSTDTGDLLCERALLAQTRRPYPSGVDVERTQQAGAVDASFERIARLRGAPREGPKCVPKPPSQAVQNRLQRTYGELFQGTRGRGRRPAERYRLANDNVVSSDDTPDRGNFCFRTRRGRQGDPLQQAGSFSLRSHRALSAEASGASLARGLIKLGP